MKKRSLLFWQNAASVATLASFFIIVYAVRGLDYALLAAALVAVSGAFVGSENTSRKRILGRLLLQTSLLSVMMMGWMKGFVPIVWIPIALVVAILAALFVADPLIRRHLKRKRKRCLAKAEEIRSRIAVLSEEAERTHYRISPDLDPRASEEAELSAVQEELVRLNAKLEPQKILTP